MISNVLNLEVGLFEVLVIFCTFFVGWVGGRAHQRNSFRSAEQNLPLKEYYKGINLLLNERPDQAVDIFLKSFEVTRETVETYVSLGTLFRRRGESARAIKIHQHLLAKIELNRPQQELIQLELARDYFHAGLFDRAQGLLNELIELGGRRRKAALSLLIQIHEQFKEWHECEKLGMMLLKAGDETIMPRIAHYMCEAVEPMLADENLLQEARGRAKLAGEYDKRSVRVLFLQAKIHLKMNDAKDALRCIKRALAIDIDFFPDMNPFLQQALQQLQLIDEYPVMTLKALEASGRMELVEAYASWTLEHSGEPAKVHFIQEYIHRYPYWKLFIFLIDRHIQQYPDEQWLMMLRQKIESLVAQSSVFQCSQCGLESQQRLWHCPSCKSWGKIRRLTESKTDICATQS